MEAIQVCIAPNEEFNVSNEPELPEEENHCQMMREGESNDVPKIHSYFGFQRIQAS